MSSYITISPDRLCKACEKGMDYYIAADKRKKERYQREDIWRKNRTFKQKVSHFLFGTPRFPEEEHIYGSKKWRDEIQAGYYIAKLDKIRDLAKVSHDKIYLCSSDLNIIRPFLK